jgi:hypothetical protein
MMNRFTVTLAATVAIAGIVAPAMAQNEFEGRSIALGKLLNTRLPNVEFNGHEFRTVVTFLSEIADLDILATWDEQGFGDGLAPNRKITLNLKNPTALVTILELVMKQGSDDETSWTLGDGFVEIGTKDQLNKEKYVRIYPVRELLFTAPRFDNAPELDLESVLQSTQQAGGGGGGGGGGSGSIFDDENDNEDTARANETDQADELIDIITSIVEPTQWESLGGEGGSIRYFRGNLLINASDYLHRQVGGYPFSPARIRNSGSISGSAYAPGGLGARGLASVIPAPRYVTLTGDFGFAKMVDVRRTSVPILVGGRVIQSDDPRR